MKKIIILFMLFMFITVFIGCDRNKNDDDNENLFYEKLIEYQEKLSELTINADNPIEGLLATKSYSIDEEKKYTPDMFLEVYDNLINNSNYVKLDNELLQYKILLDKIINVFTIEEIKLHVEYEFELEGYENIIYTFSMNPDHYIIIKIEDNNYGVHTSTVKMGYDQEHFLLKDLKYNYDNDELIYNYTEFVEDNYFVLINFLGENNYCYQHISAVNNELFLLDVSYQETYPEPQLGHLIRWYNNDTNVRSTISYVNNQVNYEYYEVFNEKGVVFDYYQDPKIDIVEIGWNMLEVTGWDYVYVENIEQSNFLPTDGIFKDGQEIFTDAHINVSLSPHYAHIRVEERFEKTQVTNEIINMSAYGLTYHQTQINLNYINNMITTAYDEVDNLTVYNGIDLLGTNVFNELLDKIDQDIRPTLSNNENN